ncbi:hypothetical protein HDE_08377 [Halotydeus destructor]|nr:hypothetical protein HDE_08377 [Halotydeus destructor]
MLSRHTILGNGDPTPGCLWVTLPVASSSSPGNGTESNRAPGRQGNSSRSMEPRAEQSGSSNQRWSNFVHSTSSNWQRGKPLPRQSWGADYSQEYGMGEVRTDLYWLIPLMIVIGMGALLLPLCSALMTAMAQAPYAYAGQGLNGQPVSQAYGHEGQLPFYSPLDYSGNDNNLAPIDASQALGDPSYGSNLSDENNVQSSLPVGPSKLLGLPSLPGTPPLPGDIYGPHYPERPLPMPGIQFPRGTGLDGGISFPADPSSDPSGVNYNTPSKPSEGRVLADSQNRLFRVRVTETPKSDQSRDPAVQRIIVNIRNRLGPERRLLFPPLNRIMLSLIAPRMLRFQFDMMLQAIVAEVVKKVVFPLIGVAAGGRGGAPAGGPATETGGGTRGTGGGASDSGGASGDGDTNEEENALPVKEVNQLLQQQLVAMGNSASKVAPTSFVVQAGPQGAPVMTAIQSPVTGMPGQMQFMVTGNQPGTGQQQQFIVQLQQPGGQIVGSGQAQQQVTATLVPMTINPMMGQASPMTGQNAGQPFMVMAQPGMGPLMTTQLTGQQVPLKPDQQIPQQIHIQFQMPSKGQHESLQVVSRDQAMAMSRPSDGQRDINNGDQSDHRDTDDQSS